MLSHSTILTQLTDSRSSQDFSEKKFLFFSSSDVFATLFSRARANYFCFPSNNRKEYADDDDFFKSEERSPHRRKEWVWTFSDTFDRRSCSVGSGETERIFFCFFFWGKIIGSRAVSQEKNLRKTHLFAALEDDTFKFVGAFISCDITEDLQIAAVMWYIKYPVDGMMEELPFRFVKILILFLYLGREETTHTWDTRWKNISYGCDIFLLIWVFGVKTLSTKWTNGMNYRARREKQVGN